MKTPREIHDEWLVLRCQGGDRAALAELVERWQAPLARHALRLTGSPDAAADVSQETWMAIARGIRGLDDAARFRRWAYRIVANKSADWIRAQQRQRAGVLTAEPVDPHARPGDVDGQVADLRAALAQLPQQRRALLAMFYVERMSLAEIADVLSIPIGTVKSRLYHAREELKSVMEQS